MEIGDLGKAQKIADGKWLTALVDPFYAKDAKFFHPEESDKAWAWLRKDQ